jgi:hypothetical protein
MVVEQVAIVSRYRSSSNPTVHPRNQQDIKVNSLNLVPASQMVIHLDVIDLKRE